MFEAMALPFLACLLLAGIHVYLGLHVLERKVIFVDLALAQIAALGAVYGVLLGYHIHEDPWVIKGYSLAFAFLGAALFSVTRMRSERVPHEAIIGITYAVALAASILGSSHLPHGSEEVSELLAGSILWVTKETIVVTGVLYLAIGAFHFVFRKKFFEITLQGHGEGEQGRQDARTRLWDFLFYFSFGFVVTSSVSIAGVLLVFSFLVIPAVLAMLFAKRIGTRLLIGWSVGTAASFVGCVVSYEADLPSGPTIVLSFASFLVVAAVFRFVFVGSSIWRQLVKVGSGVGVLVVFVAVTWSFRHTEDRKLLEMISCPAKSERMIAVGILRSDPEAWAEVGEEKIRLLEDPELEIRLGMLEVVSHYRDGEMVTGVQRLLNDRDDVVREEAVRCLRVLGKEEARGALFSAFDVEEDEYIQVEIAEALLELGDRRGLSFLIGLMDTGETDFVRRDAYEHFSSHAEVPFSFRSGLSAETNDDEVRPFRDWIEAKLDELQWNPETGHFTAAD